MTTNTTLRQQIEQEMQQEAFFEKLLNKKVKKFLNDNKQFYQVKQLEGCHAVLLFKKELPLKVDIILNDPKNPIKESYLNDDMVMFFLKNKNKHNSKSHTRTYVNDRVPFKNSRF